MPVYSKDIQRFISTTFAREDEPARQAREDAPKFGLPDISIDAEEGRFLMLLASAAKAKNAVEIGTLGGYSAIWIARGLAPGGRLTTIDVNPHHTGIARQNISAAGAGDKVRLLTGDALQILDEISPTGPFDFVFIDADKESYPAYYEWSVRNLLPGGIILAHNAFRGGRIVLPENQAAEGMRAFLEAVARDARVDATIYPGGDGTLLAVKKAQ